MRAAVTTPTAATPPSRNATTPSATMNALSLAHIAANEIWARRSGPRGAPCPERARPVAEPRRETPRHGVTISNGLPSRLTRSASGRGCAPPRSSHTRTVEWRRGERGALADLTRDALPPRFDGGVGPGDDPSTAPEPGSSYAHVAALPLVIERCELHPLVRDTTSGFTKVSIVVRLGGGLHVGEGEDIAWDQIDQIEFLRGGDDLTWMYGYARSMDFRGCSAWPTSFPSTRSATARASTAGGRSRALRWTSPFARTASRFKTRSAARPGRSTSLHRSGSDYASLLPLEMRLRVDQGSASSWIRRSPGTTTSCESSHASTASRSST